MSDKVFAIFTVENDEEPLDEEASYRGHLFGLFPNEEDFNNACKKLESDPLIKLGSKAVIYADLDSSYADYLTSNKLISDIRVNKENWSYIDFSISEVDSNNQWYFAGFGKANGFWLLDYADLW